MTHSGTRRSAQAFAPSHITGFFQIFPNGSTGAGLNTALGARTRVECENGGLEVSITINGERSSAPVSTKVLELFQADFRDASLSIAHEIGYPIGYGMGMSGAGAFSLALALNELTQTKRSYQECMEIAVRAEIESGTGLGDVVAQQFEGVMIGLAPYPSRTVEILPSDKKLVVCAFFEPLETKKIIRNEEWKQRINEVGASCMEALLRERTVSNFIALSRRFTLETGLANETVRRVLEAVPESSMAMLGQSVFALTNDEHDLRKKFSAFTDRIVVSPLADRGAHVV